MFIRSVILFAFEFLYEAIFDLEFLSLLFHEHEERLVAQIVGGKYRFRPSESDLLGPNSPSYRGENRYEKFFGNSRADRYRRPRGEDEEEAEKCIEIHRLSELQVAISVLHRRPLVHDLGKKQNRQLILVFFTN